MKNFDVVMQAIDTMPYDDFCVVMAYMVAKGMQSSASFGKDVENAMEMLNIIAGLRNDLEQRTCAH